MFVPAIIWIYINRMKDVHANILSMILSGIAGLSPYLYIPYQVRLHLCGRAIYSLSTKSRYLAVMDNWGEHRTMDGFLHHFLRKVEKHLLHLANFLFYSMHLDCPETCFAGLRHVPVGQQRGLVHASHPQSTFQTNFVQHSHDPSIAWKYFGKRVSSYQLIAAVLFAPLLLVG